MAQEEKAKHYDKFVEELSIEEKAKRYDDRLERAKKWYDINTNEGYRGIFEDIFPELAESEDERMRNVAINACKYMIDNFENSTKQYEDTIAWLEKQGEQKPIFEMITPEESLGIDSGTWNKIVDECIYGGQKPTWSENDKNVITAIIAALSLFAKEKDAEGCFDAEITWLKYLKDRVLPQPKQEWSEEDSN